MMFIPRHRARLQYGVGAATAVAVLVLSGWEAAAQQSSTRRKSEDSVRVAALNWRNPVRAKSDSSASPRLAQRGVGGYRPPHEREGEIVYQSEPQITESVVGEPEVLPEGAVVEEGEILEGPHFYEGMDGAPMMEPMPFGGHTDCSGCGDCGDCGGCGGCGSCGGGLFSLCNDGCLIPCPRLSLRGFELFGGVQGFTSPVNRGAAGSFGFNEGVNWGAPLPLFRWLGLGVQAGARTTQSNLSGSVLTDDSRYQTFVTTGLFRRVDFGLQGGVVFDYLHDDWYAEYDVSQIRGELSWVYPCNHELGFWFASGVSDDESFSLLDLDGDIFDNNGQDMAANDDWDVTDLYAFFYRYRVEELGAEGRFWAGFSGDSDALIGADATLPLHGKWSLQPTFTYLIPDEDNGIRGANEEAWNVMINLVWQPRGRGSRGHYRPLLDVAHNGVLIVDNE